MWPRERSMTVSPMSSREGSGLSRRETSAQHRPVQARVQISLPATAAPADRCKFMTGIGNVAWQPVEPTGRSRIADVGRAHGHCVMRLNIRKRWATAVDRGGQSRSTSPLSRERRMPAISGCQDELRGSATVRRRSSSGVPTSCRRCSAPRPESLSCRLLRRC